MLPFSDLSEIHLLMALQSPLFCAAVVSRMERLGLLGLLPPSLFSLLGVLVPRILHIAVHTTLESVPLATNSQGSSC